MARRKCDALLTSSAMTATSLLLSAGPASGASPTPMRPTVRGMLLSVTLSSDSTQSMAKGPMGRSGLSTEALLPWRPLQLWTPARAPLPPPLGWLAAVAGPRRWRARAGGSPPLASLGNARLPLAGPRPRFRCMRCAAGPPSALSSPLHRALSAARTALVGRDREEGASRQQRLSFGGGPSACFQNLFFTVRFGAPPRAAILAGRLLGCQQTVLLAV